MNMDQLQTAGCLGMLIIKLIAYEVYSFLAYMAEWTTSCTFCNGTQLMF